jgi:hypothetical protein
LFRPHPNPSPSFGKLRREGTGMGYIIFGIFLKRINSITPPSCLHEPSFIYFKKNLHFIFSGIYN